MGAIEMISYYMMYPLMVLFFLVILPLPKKTNELLGLLIGIKIPIGNQKSRLPVFLIFFIMEFFAFFCISLKNSTILFRHTISIYHA